MLAIFAYDKCGVLSTHFVPTGQTVNGLYYKQFLQDILRPAIRKKRKHLLEAGPVLLHDNATSHKFTQVTSLIDLYGWETLRHPAYSPDLSPSDFDLFPKLKEPMRGTPFSDLDELKEAVATEVRRIHSGCLATGIAGLPGRLKSVIEHGGRYIEGF